MFRIGKRLLAVQGVQHVRFGTASRLDQIKRSCLKDVQWDSASNRNWRLYSPSRALGIFALVGGSNMHVRADCNEADVVMEKQSPVIVENEGSDETKSRTDSKHGKLLCLDVVEKMLYEHMDAGSRTFLLGVMGTNVAVYSAFSFALFLTRQPKRNLTLLRFLSRNFLLSPGWLSRGRFHVLFTYTVTHLSLSHLIQNMLTTFGGVYVCSMYLDVWQIASLYFGGGVFAGVVSMALMKSLRKARYLAHVSGGSGGVYAILSYYVCIQNLELPSWPSVPFDLIFKAMFFYALVRQGLGFRRYVRYGFSGEGRNRINYGGHLGGAMAGLLSYGVSSVYGLTLKERVCQGGKD